MEYKKDLTEAYFWSHDVIKNALKGSNSKNTDQRSSSGEVQHRARSYSRTCHYQPVSQRGLAPNVAMLSVNGIIADKL